MRDLKIVVVSLFIILTAWIYQTEITHYFNRTVIPYFGIEASESYTDELEDVYIVEELFENDKFIGYTIHVGYDANKNGVLDNFEAEHSINIYNGTEKL